MNFIISKNDRKLNYLFDIVNFLYSEKVYFNK